MRITISKGSPMGNAGSATCYPLGVATLPGGAKNGPLLLGSTN